MEANLVPGMTGGSSYFPKACEIDKSFSYDRVIELMLSKGLNRIAKTIPFNPGITVNHNDTLPQVVNF